MFTDIEGLAREWVRDLALPSIGNRAWFGIPDGTPAMPLTVVMRVGGRPQPGEAPLEDPRLSFDVWGRTKESAANATIEMCSAFAVAEGIMLGDHVKLWGIQIDSVIWRPDDKAKLARYVIDSTWTVVKIS